MAGRRSDVEVVLRRSRYLIVLSRSGLLYVRPGETTYERAKACHFATRSSAETVVRVLGLALARVEPV